MNIIYIDGNRSSIPVSSYQQLAESYRKTFVNSCYMIMDDGILFLISRSNEKQITEREIKSWYKRLDSAGTIAGISSGFDSFDHFSVHLDEARAACETASSLSFNTGLFRYDDLRLSHICNILSRTDKELLLYPPLKKLKDYDDANGSELCTTLKLYLENPKDLEKVCKDLFIHKNTLFYRMNKIREIMGVDLYSGSEITLTLISLEMLSIK